MLLPALTSSRTSSPTLSTGRTSQPQHRAPNAHLNHFRAAPSELPGAPPAAVAAQVPAVLPPLAVLTAALVALTTWLRGRAPPPPHPAWAMAQISVNPDLLRRFGVEAPQGDSYPGLAASILERQRPGGVPAGVDCPEVGYARAALAKALGAQHQPLDMDTPGLRVRSVDPPVFTIDGFLPPEECDALRDNAKDLLQPSTIGAGKLFATQDTELSQRRTSTSVLLDESLLTARPSVAAPTAALRAKAKALFPTSAWGRPERMPPPGDVCFEALQLARYEPGQFFKEHQDGFPLITAKRNQFQRVATVLVYLNDVEEGGETRFPYLDLAITPRKGRALLFFPGFADGSPDDRMLHEATPPATAKWVAQQWVAVGVAPGGSVRVPAGALDAAASGDVAEQKRRMDAKMAAMAEHNERATALAKAKKEKKDRNKAVNDRLGPRRGFGN